MSFVVDVKNCFGLIWVSGKGRKEERRCIGKWEILK